MCKRGQAEDNLKSVSVRASIAVLKDQASGEERAYFPNLPRQSLRGSRGRDSGREPGGGNWSKSHGGALLPGFPKSLLSLLSYSTRPPAQGRHSEPPLLTSIISQANTPQASPRGSSGAGIFSIEIPAFKMTLPCINLTYSHSPDTLGMWRGQKDKKMPWGGECDKYIL